MTNPYYTRTGFPTPNAPGSSAAMRNELDLVSAGFAKLPTLTGNAFRVVAVNQFGTALVATSALQSLAITSSTINSTVIGAVTPAAGTFTTILASGNVVLGNAVTIGGGTINNTPVGNVTPSSGAFTTLSASSGITGSLTGNVLGNVTGNLTGNVSGNVTVGSGTSTFNNVTINGTLDMNAATTGTITGLSAPVNDTDAATKAYVDTVAQGLDVKPSVRVASPTNITLSGTQTIDGVAVQVGDRVLVKSQTNQAENGIYVVASGAWTRALDMDVWDEFPSSFTFVEDGNTNANSGFVCTVLQGGTLGTTPVTFEQFSGAGQIDAGAGLTKSGNQLNVGTASASRIVVGADTIDLAATGIVAGTYRSVTIDIYGRATSGTNPTTLAGYGITDAYTIAQVDNIFGSTQSAAASASAAATSELNAVNSASAALLSEQNAAGSASAALASEQAAAASFDQFDDIYLGAKTTNPTLDNDGDPLQTGALYFNTVANEMRVYDGSAWKAAGSAINGTTQRQTFTATAGQTTFTVSGGYDAGFADVYLNGVKLVNGVDVNVSSGTDVVLTVGATNGDTVDVVAYGVFSVANTYTIAETDALLPKTIRTPTITSPANGTTDVLPTLTIEGTAYAPLYSVDTRNFRQLQIDLASGDFSSPVVDQQANTDNITVDTPLAINTAHKARIRDVSTTGVESEFSPVVAFTTVLITVNEPTLTVEGSPDEVPEAPTLTTSAFATTPTDQDTHLNTDWQVLDDQLVVVFESLADAVNKTSIVVPAGILEVDTTYTFRARHRGTTFGASAFGTVIATTVASFRPEIGEAFGGGFYAGRIIQGGDAYDLVIAPLASGESATTLQYKTTNDASPAATQTLNNGPAATAAMVSAGSHPAAEYCAALSIGGFSDWYLPARDELELCYRNLKPTTTANSTADRGLSDITYPEGNDVSSDTHGVNRNSDPAGAAYTSDNPAQTSVSAFQSGNTEAFAGNYWSSSEFSATNAWIQVFSSGIQGSNVGKNFNGRVRAVRRVAV